MNTQLKTKLIGLFMILLMPIALAVLCEDIVDASTDCEMITPHIYCSTNATITNLANVTTQHEMTEINDNVYNFTFNKASGSYFVKLCDGSTTRIESGTNPSTSIATILSKINAIYSYIFERIFIE